jgi:RNase H-fold protein (predicted Holliday junction resolvase)
MRILALTGSNDRHCCQRRAEVIAQPLEFIPAEPFADFLRRLKQILAEKQVELILVGMPRNMDGSYGPRPQSPGFVAVRKAPHSDIDLG